MIKFDPGKGVVCSDILLLCCSGRSDYEVKCYNHEITQGSARRTIMI